jgi:hypothetical protein
MANRYSVLLKFLENSNSHLVFEFEGKINNLAPISSSERENDWKKVFVKKGCDVTAV